MSALEKKLCTTLDTLIDQMARELQDYAPPSRVAEILCRWPRYQTGRRSSKTMDRWFSVETQSAVLMHPPPEPGVAVGESTAHYGVI